METNLRFLIMMIKRIRSQGEMTLAGVKGVNSAGIIQSVHKGFNFEV